MMPKFPNPRYHYQMSPKSNYKVDIVTHKCDICKEKFITLTDLNKHNKIHTKAIPKSRQSKQRVETQPLRRSPRIAKPNKRFIAYDCDLCSESYSTEEELELHNKKCHQEKTDLDKHDSITHNKAKKPSKFGLKGEDGDEKNKFSTVQKKLKPKVPKCACACCAQFRRRLYRCSICNIKFFKRTSLTRHKKLRHDKTGETANKTDSTATKSDSTATKSDSTATKSDPTATKSDSTATTSALADPDELKVLRNLYRSGQSFDCEICDEICSRPDHLDIYLWTHSEHRETSVPPITYPCYVCREPLATLELKKAHEDEHIRTMIF